MGVTSPAPGAQAARLVRACLHRVVPDELLLVSRRGTLEAAGWFRQRLTLAEWSRAPGPAGPWLLGAPPTGLVIGRAGGARRPARAPALLPRPGARAACT